jgi:hypothetical protein
MRQAMAWIAAGAGVMGEHRQGVDHSGGAYHVSGSADDADHPDQAPSDIREAEGTGGADG